MVPDALKNRPTGAVAVFDGRYYNSTGVNSAGVVGLGYTGTDVPPRPPFVYVESPNGGYWSADVPVEHCAWVGTISQRATYRGYPCTVVNLTDSGAGLYLLGDDVDAHKLGFMTIERGVYNKAVAYADLDEYHEIHRDEYFDYWQRTTFGFTMTRSNWRDHLADPELPGIAYPRFRQGRFAVVDGRRVPVEGDEPPAGATEFVDVSVVAAYQGRDWRVVSAAPDGTVVLRADGRLDDRRAHFGLLYHYREIHRNLLFDRWLAEHSTGHRR